MAEIEQTPQAVPEEKKKEKGTLENVIDEIWDFGKKAIAIGAVVASPFLFSAIDPSHVINAQIFTYTVSAGHTASNLAQNKPALEGIVKRGITALPVSYQISKTFQGLNQLEAALMPAYGTAAAKAAKIGTWAFAGQPAVATTDTILNYGLGKKFRQEWWPRVKNTFIALAIPSSINVGWLYTLGLPVQMAVAGSLGVIYGFIHAYRGGKGSIKNLFRALNPFSYISASASVTYKLSRNLIGGFYTGLYDVGRSINGAIGSYQPSAPAQTAQARPAP